MAKDVFLIGELDEFDFSAWEAGAADNSERLDATSSQDDANGLSLMQVWCEDDADSVATVAATTIDLGAKVVADTDAPFEQFAAGSSALVAQQQAGNVYVSGHGQNGVTSNYNVEVVFQGTWPASLRDDFVRAADYLSTIIRGDLPDWRGVDDLRINATLQQMDGAGGTLGFAGPTAIRGNGLPTQGQMTFDIADAGTLEAQGSFAEVALHEMMHCVGLGTVWDLLGLTEGSPQSGSMRFTGENATQAYHAIFPQIAGRDPGASRGVPVETDGGEGTAGGHWDEDTFGTELMTGYHNRGNFISGMTVASLEDMGYDTIYNPANPGAAMPQLDDLLLVA